MLYDIKCIILALKLYSGGLACIEAGRVPHTV